MMNEKELQVKLNESNDWMKVHLSLADKIGFISPVHIDIDENHTVWTLTLYDGFVISTGDFEVAVDIAVDHTNSEIDKDVIAAHLSRNPMQE